MTNESIQQAAWRRLKKNRGAMFGIAIIIITVMVAVFAYRIAPDGSSFANQMTVEIGGKKPGYKQSFLVLKNAHEQPAGWWYTLLYGRPDINTYIPVAGFEQSGDSLVVQKYIDD